MNMGKGAQFKKKNEEEVHLTSNISGKICRDNITFM